MLENIEMVFFTSNPDITLMTVIIKTADSMTANQSAVDFLNQYFTHINFNTTNEDLADMDMNTSIIEIEHKKGNPIDKAVLYQCDENDLIMELSEVNHIDSNEFWICDIHLEYNKDLEQVLDSIRSDCKSMHIELIEN